MKQPQQALLACSARWGYCPNGGAGLVVLIVLLLIWRI